MRFTVFLLILFAFSVTLIYAKGSAVLYQDVSASRGVAGAKSEYLDGVIDSVVFDLDATVENSYSGSGHIWANLIASPADGMAQTDYDFFLGSDGSSFADDPTFTGKAGDSAAYWAFDGGDFFSIKAANGDLSSPNVPSANTDFINGLSKTAPGSAWWIAFAFRSGSAALVNGDEIDLFNTWDSSDTGRKNGLLLVTKKLSGNDRLRLIQEQSGSLSSIDLYNEIYLTTDTDYLFIVSYDVDTKTVRLWRNSTINESASFVYSSGTNSPDAPLTLGGKAATASDPNYYPDGWNMYHFSAGNEFLDDTKAQAIIAHLEARHGRDYTP